MRQTGGLRQPPPWEAPGWNETVEAWVDGELERLGLRRTGPMEPRPRPWSIVLTVPTSSSACYFKTTAPEMANDAAITDLLAREAPDLVLAPIALDLERRWMLLPDGGPRLRDVLERARDLGHWERILPACAVLQRRLEGRDAELLSLGAIDKRPQALPQILDELLEGGEWLMRGEPGGLSDDQVTRLNALRPMYAEACAELAAGAIGSSIQHDDLHDGNVLAGETGYRVIDWGDAGLAHPFATLLVTLRSVAHAFELGDWTPFGQHVPQLRRLEDAYLEPWSDRLSRAELRRFVQIATWTAMVGRALVWTLAMRSATDAELAESGTAVPGWLGELLMAAPAGELD
jgi:hypothetical protein